jgi:putative SOS response-associated peptidase YedK
MCGRYELNETPARLGSRYRVEPGDLAFLPNSDMRPTDTHLVLRLRDGRRSIKLRRWASSPTGLKIPKRSTPPSTRSANGRRQTLLSVRIQPPALQRPGECILRVEGDPRREAQNEVPDQPSRR